MIKAKQWPHHNAEWLDGLLDGHTAIHQARVFRKNGLIHIHCLPVVG